MRKIAIRERRNLPVEKYKKIPNYRRYWKQPSLIGVDQKLSKEQRKKIAEKFFQLVEKAGEKG